MIGRTIHEVILEQRVARIKTLLETSDLPLALIARQTGFAHVEYLSTMFKRQTGLSPSEYRGRFR
jgi:transcriptional regulator GlxA family with amidase domain